MATPDGWQDAALAELLSEDAPGFWGDAPTGNGDIAVLRATNLRKEGIGLDLEKIALRRFPPKKVEQKQLRDGDLLLERSGGGPGQPVGRVALFGEPGVYSYSNFMQRLRANQARCVPRFLAYRLSHLHATGETERLQQATTGIRNLQYKDYLALRHPIPPLSEQRKIAAILSSVDEVIEKAEAVVEQLQLVKKAMMQELLTRGLPGRHTRFKQTEIGEVPEEWEVLPFERLLASTNDALSYGILQPGEDVANGVPMLRTVDLDEQGGRSGTTLLRVSAEIESPYARTRLQGGEVLLSVMGTVGRTAVVPPEWRGWNVNRALSVIRLNQATRPEFVSFWFRSPATQARFAAEQIGSAQKRVNLSDLRKMTVPVPSSSEQAGLCAIFSALDRRQASDVRHLATLRAAKSSLLNGLLTGELRVTPDEVPA